MARVEMPVNPKILIWARNALGLQHAVVAKALQLPVPKIQSWESGESRPTLRQLEALSDIYWQPLTVFFGQKPPEDPPLPADYRRFHDRPRVPLQAETRKAIWHGGWLQSIASSLRQEMGSETALPKVPETAWADAEGVASQIRKELGPTVSDQFEWARSKGSGETVDLVFRHWRAWMEGVGVLVFRLKFPMEDARSFALPDPLAPVVALSSEEHSSPAVFSLLHELAHLLRRQTGVCNDIDEIGGAASATDRSEVACNRFAGAYLVPKDDLLAEPLVSGHGRGEWTEQDLGNLAGRFGVSAEVVVRRLVDAGRASRPFYDRWRESRRDRWEGAPRTPRRFPVPHGYARKVVGRCGIGFVRTVFDAHSQGLISLSDVSEYLGSRVVHLEDIRSIARGSAGEAGAPGSTGEEE